MAGDTAYASVSTLLHFDGANNAVSITDNAPTPKVWSCFGGAKLSTAQSKWGATALLLDGTGDYLTTPHNTAFSAAGAEFTAEAWIFPESVSSIRTIASKRSQITGINTSWTLTLTATGKLQFFGFDSAGVTPINITGATTLTANAWAHVAATRSAAGVWRLFVGGALDATGTETAAIADNTDVHYLGRDQTNTTRDFIGYIDDFRITRGTGGCRYTANFTPPTRAFEDGRGEVNGIVRDASNAPTARTVRAYRRDTGAIVANTASDATTGAYSFYTPTLDELHIICLDDAAGVVENDLILRTVPL